MSNTDYRIITNYMSCNSKLSAILLLLLISSLATEQIPYKDTDITGKFIVTKIGSAVPASKIAVSIDNSAVTIAGCNTLVANYFYKLPTKAFVCNPFSSTRKYCDFDQDSLVAKAFGGCRKINR